MPSEKKITRTNAIDILQRFAKKYRKTLGKIPGEIIIVGGGSIMLNYGFRNSTQDFDVILNTVSGIKDVISQFADENGLPIGWMNADFVRTDSFSPKLVEVSQHYCWLNNHTLEIRTISGIYLVAMKMIAHREYRNDISDAIGIIIEESERGKSFTYSQLEDAYRSLYGSLPDPDIRSLFQKICSKSIDELKEIYNTQKDAENHTKTKLISYIENKMTVNAENVAEVVKRIKEKMNQQQSTQ